MANKPIVVIGAGLSGLSAAIYLQKFGREVILFEASDRPGGRVATDNVNGFLCDRGFQLINTKYPELRTLGVVEEIDFIEAQRTIDISIANGVLHLGDPRENPRSVFDTKSGSLKEKLNFLKYLAVGAKEKTSVGYQMKLAGLGKLYVHVLKPFLTGVFFADPETVDSTIGLNVIKHFVTGSPSIPRNGAGELARVLARQVKDLRLLTTVEEITGMTVRTSKGVIESSGIVVATDATTAAQLLGLPAVSTFNGSITWYHSTSQSPSQSKNLRIDGDYEGTILNSIVLSNLNPDVAPAGQNLISTTTPLGVSETDVRTQLSALWHTPTHDWDLIAKYEIRNSLPLFAPGQAKMDQRISSQVFIAGDYLEEPSQNGALLSGRLAAQQLALN